jgi:uncharacterized protein (DUF433 family)
MATARGLRLTEEIEAEIEQVAQGAGRSWSALAKELLEEGLRMRRVPGVLFVNGATGRRAALAGTGLDVWEVVATWLAENRDLDALAASYPQLTPAQLRACLAYYQLYPNEIDARLERERTWTAERVAAELPFLVRHRP